MTEEVTTMTCTECAGTGMCLDPRTEEPQICAGCHGRQVHRAPSDPCASCEKHDMLCSCALTEGEASLITKDAMIDSFSGEHRFLSNFWPAVVRLPDDPNIYPSTEHAYQAAKTLDLATRWAVCAARTARAAKRRGQTVPLRSDWEEVKLDTMLDLLRQKFRHPELRKQLLATGGRTLIEGNTWGDVFWGVCAGAGTNHLGRLLMQVRTELAQETT